MRSRDGEEEEDSWMDGCLYKSKRCDRGETICPRNRLSEEESATISKLV